MSVAEGKEEWCYRGVTLSADKFCFVYFSTILTGVFLKDFVNLVMEQDEYHRAGIR